MAINFYGNLSLDKSEIKNVSLEVVSSLPTSPNQGRIVFKASSGTAGSLQVYPSTSASQPWLDLDGSGNVDSVGGQNGVTKTAVGQAITLKANYATSSNVILAAPNGVVGNLALSSTFLASVSGDVGYYTLTQLQAQLGSGVSSIIVDNTGAMAVPVGVFPVSGTNTILANIATTSASAGTYLKATSATAYEWAAFPTYTNTTYTLPATSSGTGVNLFGVITLTPSTGSSDSVNYKGTPNEIDIDYTFFSSAFADIQLKLSSTLQISGGLTTTTSFKTGNSPSVNPQPITVAGNTTFSTTLNNSSATSADFTAQPVISAVYGDYSSGGQWANVAYVTEVADDFVIYKGSYNANTDNPGLDGGNATQIPVEKGWAYAVTNPGNFFSEEVEIGDLLISEANKAAGTSVLSDWTVVQNKIGLATNSVAGIAKYVAGSGFKSSGMTAGKPELVGYTVTATGTASATPKITTSNKGMITAIVEEDISITASQINQASSTFNAAVQAEYDTNIVSANVGNNSSSTITVNHALGTSDVFVQVYDNSAANDPNVFAQVVRTNSNNVALTFSSIPTTNQFKVLISAIY
jgi:hypothetical protein